MNVSQEFDYMANLTLLMGDLNDPNLNPHLHPVTQANFYINGCLLPSIAICGIVANIFCVFRPPFPKSLPRMLAVTDMVILLLLVWNNSPLSLGRTFDGYILSTLYTESFIQGLTVMSTYTMLIFLATRFLSMTEGVEYACTKPMVSSFIASLTFFIPSLLEKVIQGHSEQKISELIETSQAIDLNQTCDEGIVVVRYSALFNNKSYNTIFSLLFKFLVLQVVPLWTLVIVASSTWKRARAYKKLAINRVDYLPVTVAIFFIICNTPELGIFAEKILLNVPSMNLYLASNLGQVLLFSGKPFLYHLADRFGTTMAERKRDRMLVPTEEH